jgi:multiple sugar transport system ATP-binding protein
MTMATRIAVMNKGVLQQLDTPQSLYDRPNNLFVAGFIGSPAMNFFPAKIRKDGTNLFVDAGEVLVKIPDKKKPTFSAVINKDVTFGIRPEDIYNPAFIPPGIHCAKVTAKVDVTELMGNEIQLYLVSGKHNFVARVDPRTKYQVGEKVEVAFNMDNFHIFDASENKENPSAVR